MARTCRKSPRGLEFDPAKPDETDFSLRQALVAARPQILHSWGGRNSRLRSTMSSHHERPYTVHRPIASIGCLPDAAVWPPPCLPVCSAQWPPSGSRPEMRTIISFDAASVVYVWLFYTLMSRATAEQAAVYPSRDELRGAVTVVAVVLLSLVSVIAVAALLNNLAHAPHWLNVIHLTTSLLAIALAWLLANIFFGLHYMALYLTATQRPVTPQVLNSPIGRTLATGNSCTFRSRSPCASRLRMWSSPPPPCAG